MHVIDYFQPQWGYQETYLAKEQQRLGYEVVVVTSERYRSTILENPSSGSRFKQKRIYLEEDIKTYRLKVIFEGMHRVWLRGLSHIIQDLTPDVVHMHGIFNITSVRLAFLKLHLKNFRLIYDEHGAFSSLQPGLRNIICPFFRLFFKALLLRASDGFVATDSESQEIMMEYYGIPKNKIVILPLGADFRLFRFDRDSRRYLRKELGIEDNIVITYAGKITPEKGLDILIDACTEIAKRHAKVKILIVGNGYQNYIGALREKIKNAELQDRFIWQKAVNHRTLYKIYSAADIGIWPRQSSVTMLEAMACNLPVIVCDEPAAQERISCNNGLVFKGGNLDDLISKIELLINDPKLRQMMGENGRRLIQEKLNWELITKQFIDYYFKEWL